MDKKEVKEIISLYFPSNYTPNVYTYENCCRPRFQLPNMTANIAEHIDKEFRKTSNPVNIYYFKSIYSHIYSSIVVQYNKNKTLVEILRANTCLNYFCTKSSKKYKHIRVKDIRDTTDLKYYLEGEKRFFDELKLAYEYKLKEIKRQQRIYDIAAEGFELDIEEWANKLNGFELIKKYEDECEDDFFKRFETYEARHVIIKSNYFSLKHKNILIHFVSVFTLDYKIDTKLLSVETFDDEELNSYKIIPHKTFNEYENVTHLNRQQIIEDALIKKYTQESLDNIVNYFIGLYKYSTTGNYE